MRERRPGSTRTAVPGLRPSGGCRQDGSRADREAALADGEAETGLGGERFPGLSIKRLLPCPCGTGLEADFRALEALLVKYDPKRAWGGLSRTTTPEGLTLCLCAEHSRAYRGSVKVDLDEQQIMGDNP
ncbi:hypothetical protein [Nonomuraea sp. NPDC049758]|uniref:hypothetical protein n=1 Tax=Nonomuraea sp. NPDC049758 TaxID=3154360 RepID=UPI0034225DCB